MKTRKAAHSGRFYPAHKKDIKKLYQAILLAEQKKINYELAKHSLIGAIVPHAGFMYSGYQAIHVFEILRNLKQKLDTVFIINPNHTGFGSPIAIDENEAWETPMGDVELDLGMINELEFPTSLEAHRHEHSAEVMVPFLKYVLDYDFKIVPITMSVQNFENAQIIATAIHKVVEKSGKNAFVIASSDFSHFLSPSLGQELDDFVLKEIYAQNSVGVEVQVNAKNISVCGYGPIMTLMEYAKLESKKPKITLLKRGHSGEVHASDEVVNYVSMLFHD